MLSSQQLTDIKSRVQRCALLSQSNEKHLSIEESNLRDALTSLKEEVLLNDKAKVAIEQAKPFLSAMSIQSLEQLANTAIRVIFGMTSYVKYDVQSKRWLLQDRDKSVDLVDSNGGGLVSVLSFVFDLFLLIRSGARKLLFYDEAFTAISDKYFDNFITFLKECCRDLSIDIVLVTHDSRLSVDLADSAYLVEEGITKKIK